MSQETTTKKSLFISSSPHFFSSENTNRIMYLVIVGLLPLTVMAIYTFGFYSLMVILSSLAGALGAEALALYLYKRPISTLLDGSAFLTGLLLALCLPPKIPLLLPFIGSAFAIIVGKQFFGGLGHNVFNPALVGRAFLLISWAKHLTSNWYKTVSVDAFTGATPLFLAKQVRAGELTYSISRFYKSYLIQNPYGSIGEVSALLIVLGGLFLIGLRIVNWEIPLGYIGAAAVSAFIFRGDVIFHLLAGGLLFGAFFMATAYVTTPLTRLGRFIFGLGCGFLNILIRMFSGYAESTTYAILFMNALTPLIDYYLAPRRFGVKK